jgi:signal recognition particle subunit SEC65
MTDRTEDLRWYRSHSEKRLTYIESLNAEIKHNNSWIYPSEWEKIKRMMPKITEEEAKEQCFIIKDKIEARVDHWKHLYN